jgi:hypothetical protein
MAPAFVHPDTPDFCQCFEESRVVGATRAASRAGALIDYQHIPRLPPLEGEPADRRA